MSPVDAVIVLAYLAAVFGIGLSFGRRQKSLRDYFLGSRNIPWWAAACSGVGAIVSGVAYLGAPGLAFSRDFTYHQIRLGIPLALAVLCVVMLPIIFRLNIYSIYEYLERRYDRRVRLLASALFLLSKCGYLAIVIYAPSLVVAEATGLPVITVVLATGLGTMAYTLIGGIKAVVWTDTIQVGILLSGMVLAIAIAWGKVPGGFDYVLQAAGEAGRLKLVDWSFDLTETYTVWGGLVGGTFLLIGQFGSNQAEMQRFLTTRSVRQANWAMATSLLVSTGVGMMLFFIGTTLFGFYSAFPEKGGLATDPNRVFPKFILEEMPVGLRGVLVAAVLSASMSTISVILNSLATVTAADFLPLWRKTPTSVRTARGVTLGFGLVVTLLALFSGRFGNLLEASNHVISLFIGSLTGVFLLGMTSRRASARGALCGMVAGMVTAAVVNFATDVSFLWLPPASAFATIGTGLAVAALEGRRRPDIADELVCRSWRPGRGPAGE